MRIKLHNRLPMSISLVKAKPFKERMYRFFWLLKSWNFENFGTSFNNFCLIHATIATIVLGK